MTPVDYLTRTYIQAIGTRSRWVTTSVGDLHSLEVAGKGELGTIVLLHGLSARSTHFAPMVRHLRPHFTRIIIPDALGHGLSPGLDHPISGAEMQQSINEVLNELVPERSVIYGNSLGGYGALRFAGTHPDRVVALIVNSPAGAAPPEMTIQRYLDRFRFDDHTQALEFVDQYFGRRVVLKSVLARAVVRQLRDPSVQGFIDHLGPHDLHTPEHLACLQMPMLLLWGKRDQIMTPEQLAYFRTHLPEHVHLEEPEFYGHAPYIEHPGHLSTRLLIFVRQHT